MGTRTLAALALAISSAACSHATQLSPAPGAAAAPVGPGIGAVGTETGVRVEVRSQAWSGDPVTLDDEVTPMYVEVTNNSDHSILVRANSVVLIQGGRAHRAKPPYDIHKTVRENYVYPGYGYYWAGWAAYQTVELPTADMVRLALPEGVLKPGEKIQGFLYFEHIDDDVSEVTFTFPVTDASSKKPFGYIDIPFVAY